MLVFTEQFIRQSGFNKKELQYLYFSCIIKSKKKLCLTHRYFPKVDLLGLNKLRSFFDEQEKDLASSVNFVSAHYDFVADAAVGFGKRKRT